MARSIWKGPFVDGYLLKKVQEAAKAGSRSAIKTWSRRSTILPQFVGLNFSVHNGKNLSQFLLLRRWLGKSLENILLLEHIMDIQLIRKLKRFRNG